MVEEFVYLVGCLAFFLTKDIFVGKKLVENFDFFVVVENEKFLV